MPDVGYLSQISNCTKFEEIYILCTIWNLAGSCGLQIGVNGRPLEDNNDHQFRSNEEFKPIAHDVREHMLL